MCYVVGLFFFFFFFLIIINVMCVMFVDEYKLDE